MSDQILARLKKLAACAAATAALGAVILFLVAWSGIYSVAASRGHFPFTAWFLDFGMRNSVELHALAIDAPALDDPAAIERGAGHFHGGCAPCHGAPGTPASPIAQQLLPPPPDLSRAVSTWQPRELFWIVKNGLKYTGMPAWTAPTRDDEVWSMVAFLVRLPGMATDDYHRLAGTRTIDVSDAARISVVGRIGDDPIACARCHGVDGQGGDAGGVPRLAGQRVDYLAMTLGDFATGARPSGIMGPIAVQLGERNRGQIASFYAARENAGGTRRDISAGEQQLLTAGAALAHEGDASASLPACESCHGPDGSASDKDARFPALAGQHAPYLEQQLRLWRANARGGRFGEIMAAVVRRISDEQIRAVSLYYASRGKQ